MEIISATNGELREVLCFLQASPAPTPGSRALGTGDSVSSCMMQDWALIHSLPASCFVPCRKTEVL